ncbi:MAG: flagellar basal body-associated FliL family protein [Candidatus Puniceispirillum sp.]|uniref:flagellar basal body-associated FliL family protein n=1 Tax=Candidatus Puniceispirillum sp. TaxID=2026719 RepID=UPI001ED2EF09|nr:flagellar basal body-associated FliL family protein [Candidatus Puniceispirillum sp.]MBT6415453.1 flagellar basal body-associated FliL family protein [Candidatus Puniceispirillum sp.]MBT6566589.1 flagellar basal body-associated FliL family protein [Candidatus Puniceispirillum sp.]
MYDYKTGVVAATGKNKPFSKVPDHMPMNDADEFDNLDEEEDEEEQKKLKAAQKKANRKSLLMMSALIGGPAIIIATLFIGSHLLFTKSAPSAVDISKAYELRKQSGMSVSTALMGAELLGDDLKGAETDNATSDNMTAENAPDENMMPDEYQYFSFVLAFTTNLKNSKKMVSVEIACAKLAKYIEGDTFLLEMTDMEPAFRSVLLGHLSEFQETDLDSVPKRQAATEVLRLALNEELLKYDYNSQIDSLYFTSFRIF